MPADLTFALPLHGPQSVSRVRLIFALALVLIFLGGIIASSVQLQRQIRAQSTTQSDSVLWSLAQLEIETLSLHLALNDAIIGGPTQDLTNLRKHFDIFYSRANSLQRGQRFKSLSDQPKFAENLAEIRRFQGRMLPLIDGPEDRLRASLMPLLGEIPGIRSRARALALVGIEEFAVQSDRRRDEVRRTLILAAAMTLGLVVLLAAMVVALLRLNRSNRQRAADKLATLTRMDAIVAAAHDGVVIIDKNGLITDFNTSASGIFGYTKKEAVGQDIGWLILPEQIQHDQKFGILPDSGDGSKPKYGIGRFRIEARRRDGSLFPLELSVSEIGVGSEGMRVTFMRDVSNESAAEQRLTDARDDALAGEKAKAELLAVMSHEIRTPLNGLMGTMDLLAATPLRPQQTEYLRVMETSGRLLLHHVSNVLDIARLDSGMAKVTLAPVDLNSLIAEIFDNQKPSSEANGNQLTLTLPPVGQRLVMADGPQLRQVLLNLIGNAVKFTRNGRIDVVAAHDIAKGQISFTVTDTGIGIAPENLDRVFDDFVTLDASYARAANGTGLGLGIVRRIVDGLGGTLHARSTPGQGSCFLVKLPAPILPHFTDRPDTTTTRTAPPQPVLAPLRLLLVEDNDINRRVARAMLDRQGHEVIEAHNGEEAVHLAFAIAFDAILMDISMPGMDGLQATRAIRAGRGASADRPVLALTAHALATEVEQFRAAGMRDVLIKPLSQSRLAEALTGLTSQPIALNPVLWRRDVLTSLRTDMGAEQANRLLDQFLSQTDEAIVALQDEVTTLPDLASIAHKLAGSASIFGANQLQAALWAIETRCKQGDPRALAELPALRTLWQETRAAYRLS